MRSLAFLAPLLAAASPVIRYQAVADLPDPSEIQIIGANWSGSGCPQNTVATTISPDRTVITFGFDAFQTYYGPAAEVPVSERTKNCQIHLDLRYPPGFSFAVLQSTYHGYARLDPGIRGSFLSTYFFSQDTSATTVTRTEIDGGGMWQEGQVYTKIDTVPTSSLIYAPCGSEGILNINNRIALTRTSSAASNAMGEITDDDATIAFTQQVNIQWAQCRET
jgi:hypothetical protein